MQAKLWNYDSNFIPYHTGPTPSPSKKLGTGEEFQCADNPGGRAQNYITSLHSLVGSPVVKIVYVIIPIGHHAGYFQEPDIHQCFKKEA